jgi:hypothetical protein
MKKYLLKCLVLLPVGAGILFSGCQKEDDPFVDRVQAPVLVVIEGSSGYLAGGAQYYEPVALAASIYELDKSGLLNNAVGIDSIPVAGLAITLVRRDGTRIADLTTDDAGKVLLTASWSDLGVAAPKAGASVGLSWSGQHKGQTFTRFSKVQAVN